MKKTLLLSFLLFSFVFANAQITLTSSSFPNLGDIYINHHDSLTSTVTPGSAGANQTWDFSALHNHYIDSTLVVDPATTPNGAQFPTATLAGINNGGYVYMTKSASECDFIGVAGNFQGMTGVIHYITPSIVAKSGITYNSGYNFVNTWLLQMTGAQAGYPIADSVRVHNITHSNVIVDGWGTVTTPLNSFPCLRKKQVDSTAIVVDAKVLGSWNNGVFSQNTISVNYAFVDDASINEIVSLNMDSISATVNNAAYRDSWAAGISETLKPSLFSVYPNPTSAGNIHLLIGGLPADKYAVQLFDLTGRQINSAVYSINQTAVTDINYSALQLCNGNYIAVVSTAENKILQSLKFEVVK